MIGDPELQLNKYETAPNFIELHQNLYLAHVIEKRNLRIPNPQYLQLFF